MSQDITAATATAAATANIVAAHAALSGMQAGVGFTGVPVMLIGSGQRIGLLIGVQDRESTIIVTGSGAVSFSTPKTLPAGLHPIVGLPDPAGDLRVTLHNH